jgi:hypothetical protein
MFYTGVAKRCERCNTYGHASQQCRAKMQSKDNEYRAHGIKRSHWGQTQNKSYADRSKNGHTQRSRPNNSAAVKCYECNKLGLLQENVIGEGRILNPVRQILRRRQTGQIPEIQFCQITRIQKIRHFRETDKRWKERQRLSSCEPHICSSHKSHSTDSNGRMHSDNAGQNTECTSNSYYRFRVMLQYFTAGHS